MEQKIEQYELWEFIERTNSDGPDFAYIMKACSARKFIDSKYDYDIRVGKQVWSYTFKDMFLSPQKFRYYPYFVTALPKKSYIMWELSKEINEIFIWACFTETNERKHGHINKLLTHLRHQHPSHIVKTHTFNESLIRICQNIGIELFEG